MTFFLTYARLLKMGPGRQISEIRTEAFARNKQEKFGSKHGLPTAKILVVFVYNSPKSVMLTDLSTTTTFYLVFLYLPFFSKI